MFDLLNKVKKSLLDTISGAAQNVGHFIQQDISRDPIVQGVNTIRQAAPQIQQSIQQIAPPVQKAVSSIWQDQVSKPVIPTLDLLFHSKKGSVLNPTVGDAGNFAREALVEAPLRAAASIKQTPLLQDIFPGPNLSDNLKPQGPVGEFFFGKDPISSIPTRAKQGVDIPFTGAKVSGLAALPLVAGSTALDVMPLVGGAEKTLTEDVLKAVSKSKTLDEFGFKLAKDKNLATEVGAILNDAKSPINTLEDLFKAGKNTVVKNVEQVIPKATTEVLQAGKAGEALTKVPQTGDALFSRLIGEREAAKTTGLETGSKFRHIPESEGVDVIKALENPNAEVSDAAKGFAQEVRAEFDNLYKEAKAAGIDVGYLKNYVTHIWDKPMEEVAGLYKQASSKFGFAKGREFPTYEEGIQMGLKPKYTNPSQILAEYARKLSETKADMRYLKDMEAQGLQVPASVGAGRWAPKGETGMVGKIAEIGAKASGIFQDIGMSGGIPKTPLNSWTFAQTTKEVLSGRVMSPLKALVRSTVGSSDEFFRANSGQIQKMQLRNIPVETTVNMKNLVDKGTLKNMFGESVGEAWNKTMNDPTFKKFMPQLQIQLFNDVEKGLLKAGRSAEEAADIAAKTVKNFYGITGSDVMAKRSELGQDVVSALFFAPRYRESMVNFWGNIVKGLKNPLAPENKYNMRFAIGATMTLGAMNYLNEKTMGHGMWDNPKSQRDKLLIPVGDGNVIGIPFLSSIATMPRFAAKEIGNLASGDFPEAVREGKTLLAFGLKPPVDVATNENYFGQEIFDPATSGGEKAKDIGRYLFEAYQHPYVRGASEQGLIPGFEKKDQPGYATIAKMLEAPIRFTTEKKLKAGYYFDAEGENYKKLSSDKQGVYDTVFKQDESELDATGVLRKNMSDAQLLLANPDVLAARNKIQIQTAKQTGQPVDPFNLLPPNQQMLELQRKALPPGDETKASLTTANIEWMKPYWTARAAYFEELQAKGIITPKEGDVENVFKTPPETQKLLDTYYALPYGTGERTAFIGAHPEITSYWDEKRQFTNEQRALLGLPPLEDKGFSSGGGGQSNAKLKAKLNSLNSIFKARGSKTVKPVTTKVPTAPKLNLTKLKSAPSKRLTKQLFTSY